MMAGNDRIKIIRALMLIFVGVSLVWVFAKDAARQSGSGQSADVSEVSGAPAGFTLYYFHGNVRCKTCQGLESLARQTAAESLADEIRAGRLAFRVVNFDESDHRHFINDFELPGSQLVVAESSGERPGRFLQLQDVWYLSDDPVAFQEYVAGEVRKFMMPGDAPDE